MSLCLVVFVVCFSYSTFHILSHPFTHPTLHPHPSHPSEYGFMSFKLNTCTPAWMLSFETQQLYLKNIAYQKEIIIFTQVCTEREGGWMLMGDNGSSRVMGVVIGFCGVRRGVSCRTMV